MPVLIDPLPSGTLTGYFGDDRDYGARQHQGIDLSAWEGTPVLAAHSGYATTGVGTQPNAGLGISIYSMAVSTFYCHLSGYAITDGFVRQGQVIGYVGQTGNADGPHLHFEVSIAGINVDPLSYIRTTSAPGGEDVVDTPNISGSEAEQLVASLERMDCAGRETWLRQRGWSPPVASGVWVAAQVGISPFTDEGQALINRVNAALATCDLLQTNIVEDAAAAIAGPIRSVVDFLRLLASGETWIRVGYVVGGTIVGLVGLVWLGKAMGVDVPLPRKTRPRPPIPVRVIEPAAG